MSDKREQKNLELSNPNLPASKQFGAYKVGEFAQGPGKYKVVEEEGGAPARQDANANMFSQL